MMLLDQLDHQFNRPSAPVRPVGDPAAVGYQRLALLLIGAAFCIDLFTPYLISAGILPGPTRYLSDLCLLVIILLTLVEMLLQDRIPGAFLFVIAFSLVSSVVATFEGQSWMATAWGWWALFKYPMVGIFVYIQPTWPAAYAKQIMTLCLGLLSFEVLFQIVQFLTGTVPGDHLAGSFGRFGVGPLHFLLLFVTALAFGRWLATGDWKTLAYVIGVSGVSSVLGELKAYPLFVVAMTGIVLVIYLIQGGKLTQLFTFLAIFVVSGVAFVPLYNTFVSDARGTRQLQEYLNPDTRNQYLDSIYYDEQRGTYTFGRNPAFSIGLTSIQRDATTALFGMGMGARSESTSLGIVGKALEQGYYGLNSGTTLLVFMQEIGLLGILLFVIISWGVAARLWPFLRVCRDIDLVALCYGLMLSALLWPFWLWYHQVWTFAIFNLLYWGALGYVFNQIRGHDWSQEVQDDIL